ncbi:glycosyltransferase [Tamlana fucoidanivorans]|uniref:Glycosyltransferase n=1 Tax=Allotamlana fucoidanivorans TaxID=2583814 RepID=A0A5C4SK83_9FLAO|nr:glycosyltransferase [Tamlana fucoidanivorans]TNJ44243.1 glycosyltransferase [Tamlana fucoidanivorans]
MKKRILVAPLNWGLGHATRCIPIVKALISEGFVPIIASDGSALQLLRKEFPNLSSIELPSYNITYAKNGKLFKLKLLKDSPKIINAIKEEKKAIKRILELNEISGIISDNRLGVRHKNVPSIFITHQLNVLSGSTSWLSTKMHLSFIKKFDACWVPDFDNVNNLSGKLSRSKQIDIPVKYIGPLSRFNKSKTKITTNLLVLLSGPEPQRTLLEEKLLMELKSYHGSIIVVRGLMEKEQHVEVRDKITLYNFMTSEELEKTMNTSAGVLCRSGYTTVMDLAKLEKQAFFIPTPGQFEQEYLAKRFTELNIVPSCSQDEFTVKKLIDVPLYKGLTMPKETTNFKELFNLF